MKAIILFLAFSMLVGFSTSNEYSITGTIIGFQDVDWVYIQKLWSEDLQVDSTRIVDEKFSFKGTIDIPEIYAIFPQANTEGCQPVCTFILEPSDLEIHLDTISLFNDGTLVKGGTLNDEFNRIYIEKQEKFLNEVSNLRNKLSEVGAGDGIIIQQNIKDLIAAETKYTTDYIESHPGSTVSVYLLMWKYYGLPLEEWGRLLLVLSPEMKSTSVYKRMESDYQKRLEL